MKKKLLIFGILIIACITASAQACQPKVDTATGAVMSVGSSNILLTWKHKVSGTNRLLVVQVASDKYCDSVKYAGVKLTRLDSTSIGTGTGKYNADVWYQLNPPTGTDSVKVFYPVGSGTFNPSKSAEAISFTNVNQATPFGTVVKFTKSSKCLDTILVRSDTNSLVLDLVSNDRWQYVLNAGPSQTKLYSRQYGNNAATGGSIKPGADSVRMSWDWTFCTSTSAFSAYLAVPIKGNTCITSTAGINEITQENVLLFPNPTSDMLHYQLNTNESTGYNVEITDITGKILLREKAKATIGNNGSTINVSALSPGIYFFRVVNGSGGYSTARFIKTE